MSVLINAFSANSFLLSVLVILLAILLWKRGKLYYMAWKLPGPLCYPIIGAIPYFTNHETIIPNAMKLIDKYDDIARVWFGPLPAVAIARPEHLQAILTSPHCLAKDKLVYCQDPDFAGKGIIIVEPDVWKVRRKMLSPAFNQKILDSYYDIFMEQSNILMQLLKLRAGKGEFELYSYLDKCTLDIICETAMGTKIGAQTSPKQDFFECMPRILLILMERVAQIWLYPEFIWKRSKLGIEFKQLINTFHLYTKPVIETKYNDFYIKKKKIETGDIMDDSLDDDTPKRKLFIDILLESEGKILDRDEVYQEISTFISTGTDTVALTVAYCLLALAMNQHVQDKVVEELEDIFGQTDRQITLEDIPKLRYLEMVYKESMRYFTPVPIVAREIGQDLDLGDGLVLPKHITAIIFFYRLHNNPKVWPEPDKFIPERFLPEECAKRHPYSYLPFSGGPRNCIGMRYGYMLSKLLLATILRKYKVKTTMKRETMKYSHQVVYKPIGGINISLEDRY